MIETHTRILGIAPYDGMRTAMEQAAQAYPNVEMDIYTGDLEDGQAIVQQMPPNSYDCIISRGGTAALIRQVTDLPVVDIHISVYDVLRTMKLAENYSSLYAIVGFPSITEPAHTLCSLLDFNLDILTVNNAAEVRHTLERLQQGGYRMVVCDMVTHTIAREMGFDAFLITSGVESLHAAIDQAVNISSWFGYLRQENLFLRSITQGQNGRVIVMESNGDLFYSSISEVPAELSSVLQSHIREIPASGNLRFYYTERDQLYSITAQQLLMNNVQRYLFYCVPARIPLHSSRPGLRTLNKGECEYLFANSFYSLSGAMGTQAAEIRSLALLRQPTTPLSAPPETPSTSRISSPSRPNGVQSFLPPLKKPVLPAGCGSSSPVPSSRGSRCRKCCGISVSGLAHWPFPCPPCAAAPTRSRLCPASTSTA